jgi:hypothetical protein
LKKKAELAKREEGNKHQINLDAKGKAKMTEARNDFKAAAARLKKMKRAEENVIIDNGKMEPVPVLFRQLHDQSASQQIMSRS